MMFRACFLLFVAGLCGSAYADTYLDELIAASRAKHLSEREEWRTLLHYQPRFRVLGLRSLADSPDFFNAPDGATNPQHELEATLAAFFSDVTETETRQNSQCRFIARYHWLKQELSFDPARLPEQQCKRFQDWRALMKPVAATLVFPAAYLNNPASMYGHTFLRIDGQGQTERSRLLAYAINYAASTTETNGIVFAFKGLFGGYPGNFSMSPYYVKVGEYNDLENRDMWEYELTLTPEEIDRLLTHAWELGPTRFDYYFLDENCSYHLLSLLDAARPGLQLENEFPLWAIPSETVRAVADHPGLVRKVVYRPARSTILHYRQTLQTADHIELARALAAGEMASDDARLAGLSAEDRAQVVDLAFEYLEYRRLRGDVANRDAAPRLRALLAARSKIDASEDIEVPTPAVRPDQGHRSSRLGIGAGSRDGAAFQEVRFRPAYHDLMDPESGYIRGAQIEYLNAVLRRESASGTVRLEKVNVVDIVSLAPRDTLLKPGSWRINFGMSRVDRNPATYPDAPRPLVTDLDGGWGVATDAGGRLLAYTLIEGSLLAASALEDGYSAGAGGSAGVIVDATSRWRLQGYGRALRYFAGEQHTSLDGGIDQRFTLARDLALKLDASWRRSYDVISRTATLYLDWYF